MKKKSGFVSNSSTSSFTCEICGATESGWDLPLLDAEMSMCENGHTICNEHILGGEESISAYGSEEWYYEFSEEHCPICQFLEPSSEDIAQYLLWLTGISREEVFSIIKEKNRRRRKLYDFEYVAIVSNMREIDMRELISGLKEKFGTYRNFKEQTGEG